MAISSCFEYSIPNQDFELYYQKFSNNSGNIRNVKCQNPNVKSIFGIGKARKREGVNRPKVQTFSLSRVCISTLTFDIQK
jgi:hypothetical protein